MCISVTWFPIPLVPAKAGTQSQELDARLRGHERRMG
jgi:hypothetical protein